MAIETTLLSRQFGDVVAVDRLDLHVERGIFYGFLDAALLPNPDLLFLDEPFEGVDAVTSRVIRDVLADYVGIHRERAARGAGRDR